MMVFWQLLTDCFFAAIPEPRVLQPKFTIAQGILKGRASQFGKADLSKAEITCTSRFFLPWWACPTKASTGQCEGRRKCADENRLRCGSTAPVSFRGKTRPIGRSSLFGEDGLRQTRFISTNAWRRKMTREGLRTAEGEHEFYSARLRYWYGRCAT